MKTLLLYNTHAGRNRHRRVALVNEAADRLRQNGFDVAIETTRAAGSGSDQTREAIAHGAEAIFACGGDGTIHDVLQGVAGTNAALGILPFGSANAFARELGLNRDPVLAASSYQPGAIMLIRLTRMNYGEGQQRYFLSLAGAGPDGALMYRMLTVDRRHTGRLSYYLHAARLFAVKKFPEFNATYSAQNGAAVTERAVAVMLLRVGRLGGLFSGLANGASVHADTLRLLIVRPPAWISLPVWFLSSWMKLTRFNPYLVAIQTSQMAVEIPNGGEKLHLQADGEWIGSGSCSVTLLNSSVKLLVPRASLKSSADASV